MPVLLVVDKGGSIKECAVKQYNETELYKKAGFKTSEGFEKHTTWTVSIDSKKYMISLYGKLNGRANQENKYDFPPPVDNLLFFGSCILVNIVSDTVTDLSLPEWGAIYEKLFGGFEDLGKEDSEDEEDDEISLSVPVTKEGYVKDGFVVGDDESDDFDESESDDESDDESDEEIAVPIIKKAISKNARGKKKATNSVPDNIFVSLQNETVSNDYLDCTKELVEEEYFQ